MNTQFNSEVVNFDNIIQGVNKDEVEINGFSLTSLCGNSTGIIIKTGNDFDNGNIDIGSFVSSQIDGGGVYSKKYGNKNLTFSLFIQGESYQDLLNKIDELKKNTRGVEMDLDILVGNEHRTYKATVTDIRIPSFSRLDDFVDDVEIDLLVTNGNWTIKTPTSVFFPNQTSNFEVIVNNQGTHESFPKIILSFKNTGNSITEMEVGIKNIGETIPFIVELPESITNGDTVIFDYVEKKVTINGVEKVFNNPMTPLEVGYNVVNFSFAGSVNVDAYVLYNKVYL